MMAHTATTHAGGASGNDQGSTPNTPAFPPTALHHPRSRPLSYALDEQAGSALPYAAHGSPEALPDYPPTPGLVQTMSIDARNVALSHQNEGALNVAGGAGDTADHRAEDRERESRREAAATPAPAPAAVHDETEEQQAGGGAASPVWSPAHPCFPHPNPHVPLSSPLYDSTRIIRIPRDWMAAGDLYPAFSTTYPEILIPWVDEDSFRSLVNQVNEALKVAFKPATGKAITEGILGLVSGWLLEDIGLIGPKKRIKYVEAIIDNWNAQRQPHQTTAGDKYYGQGEGDDEGQNLVLAVPLRRTAYMSLDIQIPDPKIRVVGEGDSQASRRSTSEASRGGNGEGRGSEDVDATQEKI